MSALASELAAGGDAGAGSTTGGIESVGVTALAAGSAGAIVRSPLPSAACWIANGKYAIATET
ncbi:hypothetical protein D3C83_237210 [compost metagenome]